MANELSAPANWRTLHGHHQPSVQIAYSRPRPDEDMKTFAIIVLVATACSIAAAQPAEDIALSKIVDVSAPVHCVGPVKVYKTCKFEGVAKTLRKKMV